MRRPPLARLLSSLFGLWFVLVLVDPGVLHACPEHGGHTMDAQATAHGSHHVMAEQQQGAPETQDCTCLGSCSASSVAAPLPELAVFSVSARIVAPLSLPDLANDAPVASADRLLPFANGPPQG